MKYHTAKTSLGASRWPGGTAKRANKLIFSLKVRILFQMLTLNQSVQQSQRTAAVERLARNHEASEAVVKQEYPNEKFLSTTAQLQAINK
jgi:hypothetical protein